MHEEFRQIKKAGYGVVHVHRLGAFIVLPLKSGCDLAELLGGNQHKKHVKK